MDDVQAALAKVEAEIEALGAKLEKVEMDVEAARARQDGAEVAVLRTKEIKLLTKEEQLRTKEIKLLTKEEQLREEKLIQLRAKEQGMLASVGPVHDSDNLLCSLCSRQPRRGFEPLEERARVAAGDKGGGHCVFCRCTGFVGWLLNDEYRAGQVPGRAHYTLRGVSCVRGATLHGFWLRDGEKCPQCSAHMACAGKELAGHPVFTPLGGFGFLSQRDFEGRLVGEAV